VTGTAIRSETPALARRAAAFAPSIWADVDALYATLPDRDLIFFGGGAPAAELIPTARLREAAGRAWDDAPAALDYGEVAGYLPLRRLIAERMATRGMSVDPERLLVTNGSQQGIDLVGRVLLDPGDTVVVEEPTYLGALQTFDGWQATYLPIAIDDEGLRPDALEAALLGCPHPPKLLYMVPTFQNPSGATLSRQRRERVLAIARRHGLTVVEDDPYGELWYDEAPPVPMRALDPDVVYLGTFSKTLAPGLRQGWAAAPPALADALFFAKEGSDIHNERISTRTVYHAANGFLDDHLARVRPIYRARRDILLTSLGEAMPAGVRWKVPSGGFFVWVELPDGLDAVAMLPAAAAQGVVYLPGAWFSPAPTAATRRALRLNFSTLPEPRIVEGVRRLAGAIRRPWWHPPARTFGPDPARSVSIGTGSGASPVFLSRFESMAGRLGSAIMLRPMGQATRQNGPQGGQQTVSRFTARHHRRDSERALRRRPLHSVPLQHQGLISNSVSERRE
jgi:2-aminoadipate transaminase